MHEENGQADVEQDDHADHDGVWALKNTQDIRSVQIHIFVDLKCQMERSPNRFILHIHLVPTENVWKGVAL